MSLLGKMDEAIRVIDESAGVLSDVKGWLDCLREYFDSDPDIPGSLITNLEDTIRKIEGTK